MTDGHVRLALREYQLDAHRRIAKAEERGVARQLGVAATGLGKTVIFTSLIEVRGGRAAVFAHRDELVSQAVAKVLEVFSGDVSITPAVHEALVGLGRRDLVKNRRVEAHGADVGIVKAAADDVDAKVVVCSVQTASRPQRLERLVASGPFRTIVVDEAHHAAADSYRTILEGLGAGRPGCQCDRGEIERPATPEEVDAGCELGVAYDTCPVCAGIGGFPPGPLLLGVTATPDRGDGRGLDDLFEEIVFSYDLLWGINAGFLCDVRGKQVGLAGLDVSSLKVRRGDYEAGSAGRALEAAGAPEHIVSAWQEHASDRARTLVFTPTVALAAQVAEAFTSAGIPASYVSGETPTEERQWLLRRFHSGELRVLVNCAVLTEGYDEPGVDCIIVARPTKSRALYTQMIGRGTRKHPDKGDLLVLDVVGVSADLSLLTVPNLFGIAPEHMYEREQSLTEAHAAQQDEEVAAGRLAAQDAELFRKMRAEGIAWVKVLDPKLKTTAYLRPLPPKERGGEYLPTVVMLRLNGADDLWAVGLRYSDGRTRRIMDEVPLELAQGTGEDLVRKIGSSAVVRADARWRRRPPTTGQLSAARKWGLAIDPKWNAGELSDHLDAKITLRKARGRCLL